MKQDDLQLISDLVDQQDSHNQDCWVKICSDKELQGCWRRYHIIGESLRGSLAEATEPAFPGKVMHALAAEPCHQSPTVMQFPVWARKATGWAIAASVAVLVVTMVPSRIADNPPIEVAKTNTLKASAFSGLAEFNQTSASAPNQVSFPAGQVAPEFRFIVSDMDENAGNQLPPLNGIDQFVVRHSAAVSAHNALPYARIVGYLSEK